MMKTLLNKYCRKQYENTYNNNFIVILFYTKYKTNN